MFLFAWVSAVPLVGVGALVHQKLSLPPHDDLNLLLFCSWNFKNAALQGEFVKSM